MSDTTDASSVLHFERSQFHGEERLGHGADGDVYVVEHPLSGVMAIKIFRQINTRGSFDIEMQREIANIAKCNHHPNIIRFFGYIVETIDGDRTITGYAMEYMVDRSLHEVIHNVSIADDEIDVSGWGRQASLALAWLHSVGTIHRDVKPKNMLLSDGRRTLKLCDFGCTRDQQEESMTAGIGTRLYMAPELMRPVEKMRYSDKCDVYSMGITLWEMATRNDPYALDGQTERLPLEKIDDDVLRYIVRCCLFDDPVRRPTMSELCDKLKLNTVQNKQIVSFENCTNDRCVDVADSSYYQSVVRHIEERSEFLQNKLKMILDMKKGRSIEECEQVRKQFAIVLGELEEAREADKKLLSTLHNVLQRENAFSATIRSKGTELGRTWSAVIEIIVLCETENRKFEQAYQFNKNVKQILDRLEELETAGFLMENVDFSSVDEFKLQMRRCENYATELKVVEVQTFYYLIQCIERMQSTMPFELHSNEDTECERLVNRYNDYHAEMQVLKSEVDAFYKKGRALVEMVPSLAPHMMQMVGIFDKCWIKLKKSWRIERGMKGLIACKQSRQCGGNKSRNRAWKNHCAILRGQSLSLFKNENYINEKSEVLKINIHGAICNTYPEYVKRPHTFRINAKDGSQYIVSCADEKEMIDWIVKLKIHADFDPSK